MPEINSIEQLVECFENTNPSEQINVLKSINIPTSDFEKYATWKDDSYTRNCLARSEKFEFILLCWDKGALTPVHGHGGQDCWVYQVSGKVLEKRFIESANGFETTNEMVLDQGRITYMHDRMGYHSLENVSGHKAMTLHLYANPIDSCKVFNEETGCFEVCQMQYDTVLEEYHQTA